MIHWTDIFFICYVRSTCYTCRNFFGPSLVRLRLISIPFEWFMLTTQLDESQSQLAEPHSHDQGWIIHSGPVAEPEPKLTEETQGGARQRCIQRCNQVAPVFWWQSDPMCEVRRQWWCSLRWLPNEGRKWGCCIHCQMLIKCLSWSSLSMPMLLSFTHYAEKAVMS